MQPRPLQHRQHKNAWMYEELTSEWVEKIMVDHLEWRIPTHICWLNYLGAPWRYINYKGVALVQLGLHQLCAMALKRSHTRSCLSGEGAPPQIFSTHSLVSSSFIHAFLPMRTMTLGMHPPTSFGIHFPLNTTKGRSLVYHPP